MMPYKALIVLASAIFCALSYGALPAVAQMQANGTLTNAASVLALSDGRASMGIPISLRGVVTAAETNWNGRFFVQDSSGGVFVENKAQQPQVGDLVEISGITRAGGYAPCITRPRWKKVGVAPLPDAKVVTIEQLMSGTEDGQRIQISGVL